MTPASREQCSRLGCSSRADAVIAFFVAYTAAVTHNAFQWYTDTPKIAPSLGDLDLHLTHGSLGPPQSNVQTSSRSVQLFLQGSRT